MRVLQLLDIDADLQSRRLADALKQSDAVTQLRIGGYGIGTLRRVRRAAREAELVHALSWRSLVVASLSAGKRIVFSPSRTMDRNRINWLRATMGYRDISVVVPTATMHRQFIQRGIDVNKCRLIRPGVDFSRVQRRRNLALRKELGIAEDDFVIFAAVPDELVVWAGAILGKLDERYRVVVCKDVSSGAGHAGVEKMKRFAAKLRQEKMLVIARGVEYEQAMSTGDLVLVTAQRSVPVLPIMIGMAAGLPIVSTVTSEIGELLEDRHNCLMVSKPSPKMIARRILDAREDSSLQWAISDKARAEAYELFPMSKWVEQWREVYV